MARRWHCVNRLMIGLPVVWFGFIIFALTLLTREAEEQDQTPMDLFNDQHRITKHIEMEFGEKYIPALDKGKENNEDDNSEDDENEQEDQRLVQIKSEVEADSNLGGTGGGADASDYSKASPTEANNIKARRESKKKDQGIQPAEDQQKQDENRPPVNVIQQNIPGDQGEGVLVYEDKLSPDERKKFDQGWQDHQFNLYASDMIGVRRNLPDIRHGDCLKQTISPNLPSASVIVIFHNEAWSTLLRTMYSVLDRTPPELLHEFIFVDDGSTLDSRPYLGKKLENYLSSEPGLEKVRLYRTGKREGLIRARLYGARKALGKVLTYLDSHCEVTEGWLVHQVNPIAKDRHTVVVPIIDIIDDTSLRYETYLDMKSFWIGGFLWDLNFYWFGHPPEEKLRRTSLVDDFRSPTMAGGLFSIDREFFEHLGSYDPGFEIWGGENLELSFKIWMCGGTLLASPCSRVGHIFRKISPYSWRIDNTTVLNPLRRNNMRLAEVWMDEYKYFFYEQTGFTGLNELGDVSERKALRKKIGCKSFDWYMNNVWPDGRNPKKAAYRGQILKLHSNLCVTAVCEIPAVANNLVQVGICHHESGSLAVQQYWMLSEKGEITRGLSCLDYNYQEIVTYPCHGKGRSQKWTYRKDKTIYHPMTNKCLSLTVSPRLVMSSCTGAQEQLFEWKPVTVPTEYFSQMNMPVPVNREVNSIIGLQ